MPRSDDGDDILIGGTSPYDASTAANVLALDSILAEWGSSKSFAQRVYNISNKTVAISGYSSTEFANRKNVNAFLQVSGTGKNLAADTALDSLIGGAGSDWIIGNSGGTGTLDTTSSATNEKVSDL